MSQFKRIPRARNFDELKHFTLDRNIPPALKVEPGEAFVAETEDGLWGEGYRVMAEENRRLAEQSIPVALETWSEWGNKS